MSAYLWKYYLEDDVENFKQVLEEAGFAGKQHAQRGPTLQHSLSFGAKLGSPGSFSASPLGNARSRNDGSFPGFDAAPATFRDVTLTRADVNRRDAKGLTVLHLAASSQSETAKEFALALIAHPLIDLYIQDYESGWTALHRAFYFGNITIARAIIERDSQIITTNIGPSSQTSAGLTKIKDKEGNGPYDLLSATIKDRTLRHGQAVDSLALDGEGDDEEDDGQTQNNINDEGEEVQRKTLVKPLVNVQGEECLTFGSNRNITLGFGDEDDRHFPERVRLTRPEHLFSRFHAESLEQRRTQAALTSPAYAATIPDKISALGDRQALPAVIRNQPMSILDVQMSKFHTIVLTNDPEANVYVCGHGLGGRLGTGSEKTQFHLKCIDELASTRRKFVAVALGQDHTLAISELGEVYSWGSNVHGQLGCGMPRGNHKPEDLIQMLPKQLFGPLKREVVIGAAASRIHSVVHTATSLFTFGKNEGQLGIIDAHAGSLEVQPIPRKVAASRFSCAIRAVAAIDRATVCLLENHEIHVFANYGIVKHNFLLDTFAHPLLKNSFSATRYEKVPNHICKITAGGDTICALSTTGEVFTVTVDQRVDPESSSTASTTKPNKIRSALSNPYRLWSLKRGYMAARDVAVDQDGSIILTTQAGSVWRRVRRAKIASANMPSAADARPKDFKFSRVPNLTRVLAVRASASGAYCAIRSDCDVTRTQILVDPKSLWKDFFALLSFKSLIKLEDSDTENPAPKFWKRPTELEALAAALLQSKDLEKEMSGVLDTSIPHQSFPYDAVMKTTVSEVAIPLHQVVLASRSSVFRQALAICARTGSWSSDVVSVQRGTDGQVVVTLQGMDFLTLVELVLYLHTDVFVGFWLHTRRAQNLAFRYRTVRTELMKCATRLEMANLESAVRRMSPTADQSLDKDMELALMDPTFLQQSDTIIQLANGEMRVHGVLLCQRCPFFEGLFAGRAGGRWLAERRNATLDAGSDAIKVDMAHVEMPIFKLVLRHIYADTDDELFDDITAVDLDEFLDLIMDVLSVANELMLDRLSQICQKVIGRYVNVRNVCSLLNAVAPSAVPEFKDSALEYLCLSLETVLSNHLLDELDDDLLEDLDAIVKDNQLVSLPFARSGRSEELLHEKYPELAEMIDRGRQAKIDAINLQVKFADQYIPFGTSFEGYGHDALANARPSGRTRASQTPSASATPRFDGRSSAATPKLEPEDEMMLPSPAPFDMENPVSTPPVPVAQSGRMPTKETSIPPSPSAASLSDLRKPSFAMGSATSPSPQQRPWGVTPLQSSKLSIREMLDQASVPRESNLSLGLQAEAQSASTPASNPTIKLSQKERRRQQQLRQDSETARLFATEDDAKPASPWQAVSAGKKPALKETHSSPLVAPTPSTRPPATPQLTMRQTVANSPAPPKPSPATPGTPRTPLQHRAASSPQVGSGKPTQQTPAPAAGAPATPSSSSAVPIIQSIRHAPLSPQAISPTFLMHQSMSDILSQQQAEKQSIREAAAKRSLQEIQQEQEFQEWWDQETRRVREEQEAALAGRGGGGAPSAAGRGKGGRGGAQRERGRGRGRGGRKSVERTGEER